MESIKMPLNVWMQFRSSGLDEATIATITEQLRDMGQKEMWIEPDRILIDIMN